MMVLLLLMMMLMLMLMFDDDDDVDVDDDDAVHVKSQHVCLVCSTRPSFITYTLVNNYE